MKFVDKLTFNNNTYELRDSTARDILTQQGENIAEIDGKQQVMRSEINSLQTRMGEAEQDIMNNSASISDIEDAIDVMDNDIDSNTDRITALEARVDECEDINTAQQVEINNIKNRVTTAEGNINVINGNISDINTSLDAIAAVDTQQTTQINQNKTDINTLKNRANAADTRMDGMDTRMDGIDTTIADLDDRIVASTYEAGEGIYFGQGEEHTNINVEDELLDEIHQDTQDIADLKTRVQDLETRVDNVEDDIDSIQQDITNIHSDITTINNNITTINNNITTIQQDIISIQSDISDIQSDMTGYQSEIDALKSRVTACETNIGYALTLIDSLTSRVALLEAGIDPNYIVFELLPTNPFTLRSQDAVSLLHSYADKIVDTGTGYDKSILGRITDGNGYIHDMPLLSYDNDDGIDNDNHAGTFIFFLRRNNKYYYIRLYYDDTQGAQVKTVTIDEAFTDLTPIQTQINTINTDIDAITLNITDISNDVAGLQGDVTVIQGDITNIIGDITNLQNDVNDAQSDIINLQSDVSDTQSDIIDITDKITPNVIECTVVNASTFELATTLTSDQLLDMVDDYKTKNKPILLHIDSATTGTIGDITAEASEVTLVLSAGNNSGTIFFQIQWKYTISQFSTTITNYLVKFEFQQNSTVTITSTSTSEFENTFRIIGGQLESTSEIKRIYDTVMATPVEDRHANKWICQIVLGTIYQWVYPTVVKNGTNVFIYVKYYQDVTNYRYYSVKIDSSYNVTYNEVYDSESERFAFANQMSRRCRFINTSGATTSQLLQYAGTFYYNYNDHNKPSWFPSDLSGGTYTGVIVINSTNSTKDSDAGGKFIELYDYSAPDAIYRMVRPSNNSTIGPWYKFSGTVVT